jgi:hypothetical protein
MGLLLEAYNFLKVRVIDMGIYTEQSFENSLHNILEVGRKRCPYEIFTRQINIKKRR